MAAMAGVYHLYGLEPFLFAYDHWVGLCTAALIMAFVQVGDIYRCIISLEFTLLLPMILQATYCYATSFIPGTMLAAGGNTGNVLYDVGV